MGPCDFSADIVCIAQDYLPAADTHDAIIRVLRPDGAPVEPDKDAIDRLGVQITSLFSDAIIEVKPVGTSRECRQDICVRHVRACNVTKLMRRYSVGAQGNPDRDDFKFAPREFIIVAKTAETFAAAEAAIEIGLPSAQRSVRLSEFREILPTGAIRKFSSWSIDGLN